MCAQWVGGDSPSSPLSPYCTFAWTFGADDFRKIQTLSRMQLAIEMQDSFMSRIEVSGPVPGRHGTRVVPVHGTRAVPVHGTTDTVADTHRDADMAPTRYLKYFFLRHTFKLIFRDPNPPLV